MDRLAVLLLFLLEDLENASIMLKVKASLCASWLVGQNIQYSTLKHGVVVPLPRIILVSVPQMV